MVQPRSHVPTGLIIAGSFRNDAATGIIGFPINLEMFPPYDDLEPQVVQMAFQAGRHPAIPGQQGFQRRVKLFRSHANPHLYLVLENDIC